MIIEWLGKKFGWSDDKIMIADILFAIFVVLAMGIATFLVVHLAN